MGGTSTGDAPFRNKNKKEMQAGDALQHSRTGSADRQQANSTAHSQQAGGQHTNDRQGPPAAHAHRTSHSATVLSVLAEMMMGPALSIDVTIMLCALQGARNREGR